MKKEKRFQKVLTENLGLGCTTILLDTETGVNYLCISEGYGGGVTPLLDSDGKVMVTPVSHTVKGPEF